jgi:hypothetical protein
MVKFLLIKKIIFIFIYSLINSCDEKNLFIPRPVVEISPYIKREIKKIKEAGKIII